MIVIVRVHWPWFPEPSVAVTATIVDPNENTVPGSWLYVIEGLIPLLSVAEGAKLTTLLFYWVIFDGHDILGGTVSGIVTPKVHWRLMSEFGWVAVIVTFVFIPIAKDVPDGCE